MGKNDGGPAFPFVVRNDEDAFESGMTLRDYFAIRYDPYDAISKLTVNSSERLGIPMPSDRAGETEWAIWRAEARAKFRYIEADAMLKARES